MRTQAWGTPWESDHALALQLVRATEAAALAAGRWVGRGGRNRGRIAAIDAMHELVMSVSMRGVVVMGAGEKGDTQLLFTGEEVGDGDGPARDLAISAGDGALSVARDVPNALAAIAVAEPGALYDPPSSVFSMEKLAVGPDCADVVDINRPVAENLRAVAAAKGVAVSDVIVAVLNRPWHLGLVREIQDAGARVHWIEGGDIAGAVAAARPESPVDMLLGVGGVAEGVIAAAALSCLGGALQARLQPDDTVLRTEDLVRGESVVFCATGVTASELLPGVRHHAGRSTTRSIVMCARPGTVRMVTSEHRHATWREHEEYRSA